MKDFLETNTYFPLTKLEGTNLDFKGLYSLKVLDILVLPRLFKDELIEKQTNIIYIGKGERTLMERLEEECRGKSNATFFRGMGALLGFRPPKGSLIGNRNTNNYRFSSNDKKQIIKWMNDNLEFNFTKLNTDFEAIEKELIQKYCPILNTTYNPKKSKALAKARKECRIISQEL